MPRWFFKIAGEFQHMPALAGLFASGECQIAAQGDDFFITSSHLDDEDDESCARAGAQRLLECVQMVALMGLFVLPRLQIAQAYTAAEDGTLTLSRVIAGEWPFEAFGTDWTDQRFRTPEVASRLAQLQQEDENVRDAIAVWVHCAHDWHAYAKIAEIILCDVGQAQILEWASKDDICRFLDTKDNWRALGVVAARHARDRGYARQRGTAPMSYGEATGLIGCILYRWLIFRFDQEPKRDGD